MAKSRKGVRREAAEAEGHVVIIPGLQDLLGLPRAALELAERFRSRRRSLYLVGGSVRDALLGRLHGDLDFATDARPEETAEILRGWADSIWHTGAAFGTISASKDGTRMEITTFRKEVYPEQDRHPHVTFADDILTDLERRDFTVNAMAVRLPEMDFLDPFGGLADLARKLLRTPLDPARTFAEDPLRMLRAARFLSSLELTPAPGLTEAVRAERKRLAIVSAERIRDELSRLLVSERPSRGLWFLVETGLAEEFMPELPSLALEQDPVHRHKDVLRHTLAVVDKTPPDLVLRLAALLHDIGKPKTRAFGPEGVSFHHHEVVGARMAEERLRALRYPTEVIEDVRKLVFLHMRFHTFRFGWSDSAVRRYVRDAGPLLEKLNLLVRADCTTRNPARARELARNMDLLEERIRQLKEKEDLARLRPALNGHEIMAFLGIPPGPLVGEAWRMLLEVRIERGEIPKEEAYRILAEWARERGLEPKGSPDTGGEGSGKAEDS